MIGWFKVMLSHVPMQRKSRLFDFALRASLRMTNLFSVSDCGQWRCVFAFGEEWGGTRAGEENDAGDGQGDKGYAEPEA